MQTPGLLLTILAFVAVIGPLVFVHEMGHYLVGRWFGVHADAFSIGMGREVAHWIDKRGTRWRIGMLPIGGYVKFRGDMNAASQTDPGWVALPAHERNSSFPAKPLYQRALIVAAGPAINLIFAVLILSGFALAHGESRTPTVVGTVVEGSAAAKAGLRPGDRILSLGGREVGVFDDMARYTQGRPGETINVVLDRGGETLDREVTLGTRVETDRFGNIFRLGQLGVGSGLPVVEPVSLLRAPVVGVERTGQIIRMMVETIGQVITGRRSVKEMGGPLKIAQVSGQAVSLGWETFVGFMALISINLGFINLLPIPMLDGGHLLFYAIEAVNRGPVSPMVQEWAYRSGLALLLALMMLVTFNDLSSFGIWSSLSRLIG